MVENRLYDIIFSKNQVAVHAYVMVLIYNRIDQNLVSEFLMAKILKELIA